MSPSDTSAAATPLVLRNGPEVRRRVLSISENMNSSVADFRDRVRHLMVAYETDDIRMAVVGAQAAWAGLMAGTGPDVPVDSDAADFIRGLDDLIGLLDAHRGVDAALGFAIDRLEWYRLLAATLRDRGATRATDLVETTRLELTEGHTLRDVLIRFTPPAVPPHAVAAGD